MDPASPAPTEVYTQSLPVVGKRSGFMFVSIVDALEKALEDAKEYNGGLVDKRYKVRASIFYLRIAFPFIVIFIVSLLDYFYQDCREKVLPLYVVAFSIFLGIVCLISEYFRRGASDRERDKEIHQLISVAQAMPKYPSGRKLWDVLADDKLFHSFGARFVAAYRDGEWYPIPDNLLLNGDIIILFNGDIAPALLTPVLDFTQAEINANKEASFAASTSEDNNGKVFIQPGEMIKKGAYPYVQDIFSQLKLENAKSIDLSGFAGLFRVKSTPIYDYSFAFLVSKSEPTVLNAHITSASVVMRNISIGFVVISFGINIARYIIRPDGTSPIILLVLRPVLTYLALSGMTIPIIQTIIEQLAGRMLLKYCQHENSEGSYSDEDNIDPLFSTQKKFNDSHRQLKSMEMLETWNVLKTKLPVSLRENVILDLEQLVHNLGAITNMCVLDEHVILAERASCEEVCIFHSGSNLAVKDLGYDRSHPSGLRFEDPNWESYVDSLKPIGLCCALESLQHEIFLPPNKKADNQPEVRTKKSSANKENKIVSQEVKSFLLETDPNELNRNTLKFYEKLLSEKDHGDVLNFIGLERLLPSHMHALAARIGFQASDIDKKFKIRKRYIFYDRKSAPEARFDSLNSPTSLAGSWAFSRGRAKFAMIVVESLTLESIPDFEKSVDSSPRAKEEGGDTLTSKSSQKQLVNAINESRSTHNLSPANTVSQSKSNYKYHLFFFGHPRLLISYCTCFWDGKDLFLFSAKEKAMLLHLEKRWELEEFERVAFSYTPVSSIHVSLLLKHRLSISGSDTVRIICPDSIFDSNHEKNMVIRDKPHSTSSLSNVPLNRFSTGETGVSNDSDVTSPPTTTISPLPPPPPQNLPESQPKKDQQVVNPAPNNDSDFFKILSMLFGWQIFTGIVASREHPRPLIPRMIENLHNAGIRFVNFSPRVQHRARILASKMGLETDWNTSISLKEIAEGEVRELWDLKAKLPHGIQEIRRHLKEADDIPLRVSTFTDSTPSNIRNMLVVMKDHGELVGAIGSGDHSLNMKLFLESNLSIGIVSDTQLACQRIIEKRCSDEDKKLRDAVSLSSQAFAENLFRELGIIEYSSRLSFAVTTLPCALILHGENRYANLIKLLNAGRRILYNFRQSMVLYFAMSLTTATLMLVSYCFSIENIYGTEGILWLQWIHFPLLTFPNVFNAAPSGLMTHVPPKRKNNFWDHVESRKRLIIMIFYAFIRITPTALFIVALYCGVLIDIGNTPPNNYPFFNSSLVLWGQFDLSNTNWSGVDCVVAEPSDKVSPACISLATIGFCQFAYIWALMWIAATFARRIDPLWKEPRKNLIWWFCAILALLIQFGVSSIPLSGRYECNSPLLWVTLPNPYAWIAVVFWPIIIILIAEACKYHDGKVLKDQIILDQMIFQTRLGQNSPV